MLPRRDRPTLRRNHQRTRIQDRSLRRRDQVACPDCARARRIAGDDAVLRRDARRSHPAPEQLVDTQLRTHAASGIVSAVRALISAALLLTLATGLRSAAAQPPSVTAPRPGPAPSSAAQPAADVPRVRLLATGGTISNRIGGRLTAAELVASIPNLERYVRAEFEQFANTSSAQMTIEQW